MFGLMRANTYQVMRQQNCVHNISKHSKGLVNRVVSDREYCLDALISFKVENNSESGLTGCYETNPGGRHPNDTLSTLESKPGLV